jgi:hypothetical protein
VYQIFEVNGQATVSFKYWRRLIKEGEELVARLKLVD